MSRRHRWVAPIADFGILMDPPVERVAELLEVNRRRFASSPVVLLGRPLSNIRAETQARIRGAIGPLLVTGHQPELYHPGVWIKNFALNGLARKNGLTPVNLNIDTDTIKSTSISVPVLDPDPARVHRAAVPFDEWDGEAPWATRLIRDPAFFAAFPQRVKDATQSWIHRPILFDVWPRINESYSTSLGEIFASMRCKIETSWGCRNIEVPLSGICPVPALTLHVLSDLPRFQVVYNECIRAYRQRHSLRSRHHPAPELVRDGDKWEAPFWWHDGRSRHRLFVEIKSDRLRLFAGRNGATIEIPSGDLDALGRVNLSTRALMTTLTIRLCLADLFIHGIGGAKYDEVTDEIVRRYFEMEPPEYMVVSGTLRLPLPRFPSTQLDRDRLWRRQRDLKWNPDQFIDAPSALIDQKRRWRDRQPMTPHESKARFRELRELVESLRPAVADQSQLVEERLRRCDRELAANAVLSRRDYSFVLYPEDLLQRFLRPLL